MVLTFISIYFEWRDTENQQLVKLATSGLSSMCRSDWLSYYYAICYSPLVAKNAGFLAAKKELKSCFKLFCPTSWIILKQLFLSPSWAIDSEPIRARGIIVKEPIRVRGIIIE